MRRVVRAANAALDVVATLRACRRNAERARAGACCSLLAPRVHVAVLVRERSFGRAQELYGDSHKVAKLMQIDESLVLRRRELTALLKVLDEAAIVLGTVVKPTAYRVEY